MTAISAGRRAALRVIGATNRWAGRPMTGRDRMWGDISVVISIGAITMPARADLVAAVRRLAQHSETTRIGWIPKSSGRGWEIGQDIDALAELTVATLHDVPGQDVAAAATQALRRGRSGLPFRLYAGPDSMHMNVAHRFADGYSMQRVMAAVIQTAHTGELPTWVRHPPVYFATSRAALGFFRRNPDKIRALARQSRKVATQAREAAVITGGAVATGVAAPPAGAVAWSPSIACRYRASSTATFNELKAWRKQHLSGLSTIPLAIGAAETALRNLGIQTSPSPLVLFDARRYLRDRGADITGNFCAGLRLDVPDNADAAMLDQQIKAAVAMGRPLAVLAAGSAQSFLRRAKPKPTTRTSETRWDMAYTHMGRPADLVRLPFLGDMDTRYFTGLLPPASPQGVTICFTEIGNRINASASFHDNVIDPATVEALLDLVCDDPVALLEQHRLRSSATSSKISVPAQRVPAQRVPAQRQAR